MANGGQGGPLPSTSQQPVQRPSVQPMQHPGMGQFQHPGMMQHPGMPGQPNQNPQAGKGPGQPAIMPTQQPGQMPQFGSLGQAAIYASQHPGMQGQMPTGQPITPGMVQQGNPNVGLGQLPPQGLGSLSMGGYKPQNPVNMQTLTANGRSQQFDVANLD